MSGVTEEEGYEGLEELERRLDIDHLSEEGTVSDEDIAIEAEDSAEDIPTPPRRSNRLSS